MAEKSIYYHTGLVSPQLVVWEEGGRREWREEGCGRRMVRFYQVLINELTSILSDITNPGKGLVSTLLNDFQVPHLKGWGASSVCVYVCVCVCHLYSRCGEVWNLKLDSDWWSTLSLLCMEQKG